jgi:NitT/TauT family transport system permease protein
MKNRKQTPQFAWYWWLVRLVPGAVFFVVWQFVIWADPSLAFFIGSPHLYVQEFAGAIAGGTQIFSFHFSSGALLIDVLVTAYETLCGFIIGNVLGILAGLSLSRSKRIAYIAKPYIILFGVAPLFAFAPIIVLWFGIGLGSKIIVAALSTLFVALMQAFKGATEVDPSLLAVSKAFGATERQTFRKIVIPSAAVWVINGFRLNVGFALLGAFLGEFINSSNGLGHLILVAGGLYNIPLVLVGVTTISLLGLGLTLAVDAVDPLARKFLSRAF